MDGLEPVLDARGLLLGLEQVEDEEVDGTRGKEEPVGGVVHFLLVAKESERGEVVSGNTQKDGLGTVVS